LTVQTPTFVNGGSSPPSTSTCIDEFEPGIDYFPGKLYTATYRDAHGSPLTDNFNTAPSSNWLGWGSKHSIPQSNQMHAESGDSWITHSTTNDLVYFSNIGYVPQGGTNVTCLAVAGGDPDSIPQPLLPWAYPTMCPDVTHRSDQPAVVFDDGLRTFFAAYKNAGIRLAFFKNCTSSPGYTGCLKTADALISQSSPNIYDTLQFGIDVNPCTNHLVVAFRPQDGGTPDKSDKIFLRFYDRDGVQRGVEFQVASGYGWAGKVGNAVCSTGKGVVEKCNTFADDCGSGPGNCLADNARPSVRVKFSSTDNKCHAIMAWDYMSTTDDGFNHVKSAFASVDITNESAPVVNRTEISSGTSSNFNQYYSYVTTSGFSENVGWFWTSDNQGACSVGWEGAVSTNLGTTATTHINKFSGTFPAIMFGNGQSQQDYAAGLKDGPTGGWLQPLWDQSVQTSANCVTCQSVNYSNATKTTQILP